MINNYRYIGVKDPARKTIDNLGEFIDKSGDSFDMLGEIIDNLGDCVDILGYFMAVNPLFIMSSGHSNYIYNFKQNNYY